MGNQACSGDADKHKQRRHSDEMLTGAGQLSGNCWMWSSKFRDEEYVSRHIVLHGVAIYAYEEVHMCAFTKVFALSKVFPEAVFGVTVVLKSPLRREQRRVLTFTSSAAVVASRLVCLKMFLGISLRATQRSGCPTEPSRSQCPSQPSLRPTSGESLSSRSSPHVQERLKEVLNLLLSRPSHGVGASGTST